MKSSLQSSCSGSLDIYLKEIGAFPLLSREEEYALAVQQQQGIPGARERLINSNLRLVVSQARKFQGMGLSLEDLIAEGNTGLITAVERFDPEIGAGLCTYAVWWIRQRILRAIENGGRLIRLPVHVLSRVRKLRTATAHLAQELGREPEDWEVALYTGTSEETVALTMRASAPVTSLDQPGPDGETPVMDRFFVTDTQDPSDAACRNCDGKRARLLLVNLPDRLRLILERRFGIGCDCPQPLSEIGRDLGLTRERIRQLERKGMILLRQAAYRMDPDSNSRLLDTDLPVPSRRVRGTRKETEAPPKPAPGQRGMTPAGTGEQKTGTRVRAIRPSPPVSPRLVALPKRLKNTG